MGAKHQKFVVDLSGYSPAEREAIAGDIIRQIQKRTKQGVDKDGQKFPSYTSGYKKSRDFKIAGKTSKVDLVLSGDMLDSIELLKNAPKAVIGFERGSNENGKADGNIRGTYGQDTPIEGGKYARDFLGLSESELKSILRKYPKGSESRDRASRENQKTSKAKQTASKVEANSPEEDDE